MRAGSVVWLIVIILGFFFVNWTLNLQVVPERAQITYFNRHYLHNVTANVRRYGRKSAYYINVGGTTLHTWGNNITVHLIFYEFLHNEYKRSFVEMHFKGCDMVMNDPYVGQAIASAAAKFHLSCPVPPGVYSIMNISVPVEDFPNIWPFEKFKVEIILQQKPTNDIISKCEIYAFMKHNTGKRFKNRNKDDAVKKL